MADREKRKTSPPSGRNIQVNSPASFRLTHDISLDEFEDDDLSEITEITDECGMSLNCNGPDIKKLPRGDLQPLGLEDGRFLEPVTVTYLVLANGIHTCLDMHV